MQEAYSMSVLMYVSPALILPVGIMLFGEFLDTTVGNLLKLRHGLGRLNDFNVTDEFLARRVKFYKRLQFAL